MLKLASNQFKLFLLVKKTSLQKFEVEFSRISQKNIMNSCLSSLGLPAISGSTMFYAEKEKPFRMSFEVLSAPRYKVRKEKFYTKKDSELFVK